MNLFDEGFKVRGIFLDIPEAFDKVEHGCFNSNCSNMVGKALCISLHQLLELLQFNMKLAVTCTDRALDGKT